MPGPSCDRIELQAINPAYLSFTHRGLHERYSCSFTARRVGSHGSSVRMLTKIRSVRPSTLSSISGWVSRFFFSLNVRTGPLASSSGLMRDHSGEGRVAGDWMGLLTCIQLRDIEQEELQLHSPIRLNGVRKDKCYTKRSIGVFTRKILVHG